MPADPDRRRGLSRALYEEFLRLEFEFAASRGSDFHSPDESHTDLGALLVSRVCHDLISPVAAISNDNLQDLKTGQLVGAINVARRESDGRWIGDMFDGRVAEDFKLTSGTWVSVGTLRPDLVLGFSDLQADIAAALIRHGVAVHAVALPGDAQQLTVKATFSDGSVQDVSGSFPTDTVPGLELVLVVDGHVEVVLAILTHARTRFAPCAHEAHATLCWMTRSLR